MHINGFLGSFQHQSLCDMSIFVSGEPTTEFPQAASTDEGKERNTRNF
jgi:hypothetical protein